MVASIKTVRLTTAQALIRFLENQYIELDGVEHKFVHAVCGIFGHGNVAGIGEALAASDIQFIQGYNEQGLVHMASAFAKEKRRLGIMAVTTSIGPGALNMVTAAATATINRIPVLLLPGDVFASRQPDPVLQQLEHTADVGVTVNDCFKPVSVYWDRINRPEQLMTACLNAFRYLTDPADCGAVTLCLPQDVQTEAFDFPLAFFAKRTHHVGRRSVEESQLEKAASLIKGAKRPMILCGGGVHYAKANNELSRFATEFGIPVAETQAGKGALSASHPQNIGALGVLGTEVANNLAARTDLVLALGTRLGDFTTASKTVFKNANVKMVHVNLNRADAFKMDSFPLVCDAKVALSALTEKLSGYKVQDDYAKEIQEGIEAWRKELAQVSKPCNKSPMSQTHALSILNEHFGQDDVVVGASGSLPGDLMRLWQCKNPNTFHLEYGFSCMGYEVSGALGVKFAKPQNEVYAIVGDGAFLMMHVDLLTSLQENQKINVILFNNKGYRCIQNLQNSLGSDTFGNVFRRRNTESTKLDGEAISADFSMLAKALGVASFQVKSADELPVALRACQKETRSTLIEIEVAPDSMSHGYNTWWRVDGAQVSTSEKVVAISEKNKNTLGDARSY